MDYNLRSVKEPITINEQLKRAMKINQKQTAIQSHRKNQKSGYYLSQEREFVKVLLELARPTYSREVYNIMAKDKPYFQISNVTRIKKNLEQRGTIEVVGTTKSITGRTVETYQLVLSDTEPKPSENQLSPKAAVGVQPPILDALPPNAAKPTVIELDNNK